MWYQWIIIVYERKNKTQKTKESQYAETDEHPFHSNEISHSGVVNFEHDD